MTSLNILGCDDYYFFNRMSVFYGIDSTGILQLYIICSFFDCLRIYHSTMTILAQLQHYNLIYNFINSNCCVLLMYEKEFGCTMNLSQFLGDKFIENNSFSKMCYCNNFQIYKQSDFNILLYYRMNVFTLILGMTRKEKVLFNLKYITSILSMVILLVTVPPKLPLILQNNNIFSIDNKKN